MERIKTQEEIDRTNRRNRLAVGIVLIFLMVSSSLGYAFFSSSGSSTEPDAGSKRIYGEFISGRWVYETDEGQFGFLNYIDLAKKTDVSVQKTLQDYMNKPLYIDSGGNTQVIEEISLNLGRYVPRLNEACYSECDSNLPEKTCADNLIVFREMENMRVYQQENCIFIEGNMAAADAFLYKILGFT